MAERMRILVLSDNNQVMERAMPVFAKHCHRWLFTDSGKLNPKTDYKYISDFDLVFSLHCKVIFPKILTDNVRCINIHPGYNPYNRGMFPHVWSIINGLPAGVTIHEMNEGIDTGPTIFKRQVEIHPNDTSCSLYSRIIDAEIALLAEKLEVLISGEYKTTEEPEMNYHSMKDFKKLCSFDPDARGTFGQFFDRLRALSHGNFWNANTENIYFKILIK